ncbi:MAG: RedB protein [Cyanobacteria bacterium REEB67]|nr:RedB protein [Cyanobacteria bacterium REEB67]
MSLAISSAAWIISVGFGFQLLLDYGSKPGPQAAVAPTWPQGSTLDKETTAPTLLVFLHPKCPCSNATLSELAYVVARHPELRTRLIFIKPTGAAKGWEDTALWRRALALPGATVVVDGQGREANAFAARTSGQCFLYDRLGHLQFAGGITGSRGHEGDNQGLCRLEAALDQKQSIGILSPTFGCPLNSKPPAMQAKIKCLN